MSVKKLIRQALRPLALAALLAGLVVGCANPLVQESPAAPQAPASRALAGPADDSWNNATNIYQVYVTKFTPEGTISALTGKIGYLKDLGVKAIWLMPVFQSMSDHGYDATDYYSIKSNLGSNGDFQTLCATAHTAGIRVILDLVINHTGSGHPWFSSSDPAKRHDNWYCWSSYNKNWQPPWDYSGSNGTTWYWDTSGRNRGYFYGAFSPTQPDLNWNDPTARQQITDEVVNIMKFWLDLGADGFRCDAARYLVENAQSAWDVGQGKNRDQPETHAIWQSLRSRMSAYEPRAILLAESPTETYPQMAAYYGTVAAPEFQSAFHFKYSGLLMDCLKNGYRNANFFTDLFAIQSNLPYDNALGRLRGQDAVFLSNHDRFTGDRVASQLGMGFQNYSSDGTAYAKTKLAASVLLTLSGNPTIYYGDEYGAINTQPASTGGDDPIRPSFDWTRVNAMMADSGSMYNHYKGLLRIRNVYDALRGGRALAVPSAVNGGAMDDVNASSNRIAFEREFYGETMLVVHNPTGNSQTVTVNLSAAGLPAIAAGTAVSAVMGGGSYPAVSAANAAAYPVGTVAAYCTKVLFLGNIAAKYGSTFATYEGSGGGGFKTNYGSMNLRGTMNSWACTAMTLVADYTWQVSVNLVASSAYQFKFDALGNWAASSNWGAGASAGTAALGGGNIAFTSGTAASYTFSFNESTLAYSVSGGQQKVATPGFNPPAGAVASGTVVTISSATAGSTVYYTTDGTTPTTASAHGTAGAASATVTVTPPMTLKAYAVKSGMADSDVATAAYTPLGTGTFTVVFKSGANNESVSFPGDVNNWSLTSDTLTAAANTSYTKAWTGAVSTVNLARGNSTTALELKLCNTAGGWNGQWGFGSWTKSANITLGDSNRQITIACTAGQNVTLTIDVGATSLSAVVQ
jgi:glycosidase